MEKFKELGLEGEILKGIEDLGFEVPSPVQEKVIPVILGEENDLVALAQTGTGKTGYLSPVGGNESPSHIFIR